MKRTDIVIEEISYDFEDFPYRMPLKFAGVAIDRVTVLNVTAHVHAVAGRDLVSGFGSMPLGNVWAFPSRVLSYEATLAAMKALVERISKITSECKAKGHPIDLNAQLEPEYLQAAEEIRERLHLPEPIPKLCTLVAASAFDAALHDAFGKVHGRNCYHLYGQDFMSFDLAHYLGPAFKGEFLDRYLLAEPRPRMPLYHLVGALDSLEEADINQRLNDGFPETLAEWIGWNGLTHLKIKLNGDDPDWDLERVLRVDRVAASAQHKRGVDQWCYSLDFNERCEDVGYLLTFLQDLKKQKPAAFERIEYVEQPTGRDLKAQQHNRMHEAARVRPVVIDESLTDLDSLRCARDMGYTGVALKACKGQSQSLLLAAAAQKDQLFLCVQDLTCPGASLIHSAGLAAHLPGVAAIEANARQYVPAANRIWEARFPGLFHTNDGMLRTDQLIGTGLGAVEP